MVSFSTKFWIAVFAVGIFTLAFLVYVLLSAQNNKAEASSIENISKNGEVEVSISDKGFVPQNISVASGVQVRWKNNGVDTHTVTFSYGASLDSVVRLDQELKVSETVTFKFEKAGTFHYFDKITGLGGSIEVK